MKKLVSLVLALLLMIPLAGGVAAEDFDVTQHVNPFSPFGSTYSKSDFYGDGKMEVLTNIDSPIPTHELTAENFPLLDIETVITAKGDVFYIVLKDKSDKAMVEAMDILYNNYRDIVNTAWTFDSLIGLSTSVGDINGDHWIDLSDVTALLKYLACWDVFIYTMHADVNGDLSINMSDVTCLLQAIAKWPGYSLGN